MSCRPEANWAGFGVDLAPEESPHVGVLRRPPVDNVRDSRRSLQGGRMQRHAQVVATVEAIIERVGPGVTSTRKLVSLGISDSRIETAVARGELLRLRRGSVLPTSTWAAATAAERHRLAVDAALIAHPTAVVSHTSAAQILSLPLAGWLPTASPGPSTRLDNGSGTRTSGRIGSSSALLGIPTVHLTIPGRHRTDAWLRIHGSPLPAAHWATLGPVPVTGYSRTLADTASMLKPGPALALADAAVRQIVGQIDPHADPRQAARDDKYRTAACRAVSAVLDSCAHRTGIDAARQALALANPASESVLESISRWQMHRRRLPMPQCGMPITGDDGRTYWADFVWWDLLIIGEADGALKYATRDDLIREKARQEALERAGWLVIRWNWAEAVTDPRIMIRRIERAIERRRMHPPLF